MMAKSQSTSKPVVKETAKQPHTHCVHEENMTCCWCGKVFTTESIGESRFVPLERKLTLTADQCNALLDVLNAICELETLSENADDQPWTILKFLSEKAGPLADDLCELRRQSKE